MKRMNFKKAGFIAVISVVAGLTSCNKVKDGVVIEDSYSGNVNVTSTGSDPGGDITGNGDGGTYSFGWENPEKKAEVNFDISTPTGSMQVIILDADDKEVLNRIRSAGGPDSYSGVTSAGENGIWTVTLIFTDFDGDGSYSISPGT